MCYEYMYDSSLSLSQHPSTSYVFDIYDEPQSPDLDLGTLSGHSSHRVKPIDEDFDIIDFGTRD